MQYARTYSTLALSNYSGKMSAFLKLLSLGTRGSSHNHVKHVFSASVLTCRINHEHTSVGSSYINGLVQNRWLSLLSANTLDGSRMLQTRWDNGRTLDFPYVWLRDNCQCSTCFHPYTKARLILMEDLEIDAKPLNVQVQSATNQLLITWEGDHVSKFEFDWLWKRRFTQDGQRRRAEIFCKKRILWGSEIVNDMPIVQFDELLEDDRVLYKWLCNLEQYGLCLIQNAPSESQQLARITERVSFPRKTHYGAYFTVRAKNDPSNLAYTSDTLGLHTDIPYDLHPPGVQMLHCIHQTPTEGGDNVFSDSFKVAEEMKIYYPGFYKLLCEVPVDYIDVGKDYYGSFYRLHPQNTFALDSEGVIRSMHFSNQTRDSHFRIAAEQVEPFMRALRKFNDMLYMKENLLEIKLKDGDIMCFHNNRVLHGRSAYKVTPGLERHLQGAYMDWTEISSRRRCLELDGKVLDDDEKAYFQTSV